MMLEEMLKDEREAGKRAGRIEGEKAGSQKTKEQLNILAKKLSRQGRLEDVIRLRRMKLILRSFAGSLDWKIKRI